MTWHGRLPDDRDFPPIDDATAESLLTGGEVRPDLEPVAAFLRALRDTARRRVAPSARLAAHMAGGGHAAQVSPHWYGALSARAQRRPLTITRFVAWASVGGLVAALGIATAGFAGALPEPAQHRFEDVVRTVTGYDFPDASDGCGAPDHRPETRDTDVAGVAQARTDRDDGRPVAGIAERDRPFGAWVRGLGPGLGHGEVVSAWARAWSGAAGPGAAATPGAGAQPGAGAKPGGRAADVPPGKTAAGGAAAGPSGAKPGGAGRGGAPVQPSAADRGGPPGRR